jgi:transcriptional regulator GlxA family with amidase domain
MVRQAYSMMLDELAQPQLGARALTSALMKACMVLILRKYFASAEPLNASLPSLSDPRFAGTIRAILDRPADSHTLETMARTSGMSRSNFAQQFHTTFGITPGNFVSKTRLFHAAQLLRSTPLPVKTIAGISGFSSRSHFSRAFRTAYGVDPTAFRNDVREGAIDPPAGL